MLLVADTGRTLLPVPRSRPALKKDVERRRDGDGSQEYRNQVLHRYLFVAIGRTAKAYANPIRVGKDDRCTAAGLTLSSILNLPDLRVAEEC